MSEPSLTQSQMHLHPHSHSSQSPLAASGTYASNPSTASGGDFAKKIQDFLSDANKIYGEINSLLLEVQSEVPHWGKLVTKYDAVIGAYGHLLDLVHETGVTLNEHVVYQSAPMNDSTSIPRILSAVILPEISQTEEEALRAFGDCRADLDAHCLDAYNDTINDLLAHFETLLK